MLFSPHIVIFLTFALVAFAAQELKVGRIVAASIGNGDDVVDFELAGVRTSRALAELLLVKGLDVLCREAAAVSCLFGSVVAGVRAPFQSPRFGVFGEHASAVCFYFVRIGLDPLLSLSPMSSRVFGATLASPRSSEPGVTGVVTLRHGRRALDALPIRDQMSVLVAVLAGLTHRVVQQASLTCRDAIRMLGAPLLAGDDILDRAGGAQAAAGVALGQMTISTRLAGPVEPFSRRLGRFPFGHWLSHQPISACMNYVNGNAAFMEGQFQ